MKEKKLPKILKIKTINGEYLTQDEALLASDFYKNKKNEKFIKRINDMEERNIKTPSMSSKFYLFVPISMMFFIVLICIFCIHLLLSN